jgi:hypothetical protein
LDADHHDSSRHQLRRADTCILHLKDDGSYERLSATVDSDGNISFKTASLSSFVVMKESDLPAEYYFDDVASDAWYLEAVQYVYDAGLMSGTDDNQFSPNATTTRGMIVTMLWRLAGEPTATDTGTFTDLTQDWYTDAINWAAANDIVSGYGTTFGPDDAITREQFASICTVMRATRAMMLQRQQTLTRTPMPEAFPPGRLPRCNGPTRRA